MRSLAIDLLVGPAVVVDDDIDQENAAVHAVVTELEQAHFPVLRRRVVPADEEIDHWQAMSLIVLDWDLLGAINIAQDYDDSNEASTLLGVVLPDSVVRDPKTDSLRFVRKLMKDLYCPIFIISNLNVEAIWEQLEDGLNEYETQQLRARVFVNSKEQGKDWLLEKLGGWIKEHPAIYALKSWERSYERAKTELFHDFQHSAVGWPKILWQTADRDGVNPNYHLTETISRNLLQRMEPHEFPEDVVSSTGDVDSLDSVRRVLHQQAVLPSTRLHADVIMPGDYFFEEAAEITADTDDAAASKTRMEYLPDTVDICLTPACDLVARNSEADDIKMFMVRAHLVTGTEVSSKAKIKTTIRSGESTTSVLLHHLVPEDAMYRVRFKDWYVTTWGEVRNLRRGRLLEPYVTLLQQRNSLFFQRKGLPLLPQDFHEPRRQSG